MGKKPHWLKFLPISCRFHRFSFSENKQNTVQPVMSIFIDLWNVDCWIQIMNGKVEKLMHAVHCHIKTLSYVLLSYWSVLHVSNSWASIFFFLRNRGLWNGPRMLSNSLEHWIQTFHVMALTDNMKERRQTFPVFFKTWMQDWST